MCNINENEIKSPSDNLLKLIDLLKSEGSRVITLAAKIEEEINALKIMRIEKCFLMI